MYDLDNIKFLLKDYLTFYHEIRIPQHDFFIGSRNVESNSKILVISSPSRMGNHLLLSMIDNHPEIPRIPGEDGFLYFSFLQANYDIHRLLNYFKKNQDAEVIAQLATNFRGNKWRLFKEHYEKNEITGKYSGIVSPDNLAVMDYENTIFPINFDKYYETIDRGLKKSNESFAEFFNIYCSALVHLDFSFEINKYSYDKMIAFSGMRSQCQWLLNNYKNVKIIVSIRPFESYVFSHVKSRYQKTRLTNALIQEAWEHWFHKTMDFIYLKLNYPRNVCLVSFDNLINNSVNTAKAISNFLEIDYHNNMSEATIFGIPVKGNSSESKKETNRGQYYSSNALQLENHLIPNDYEILWSAFKMLETK
jgi:hypothetical protein